MHKPKILFFDIDGTLIDMQKKCITPLMLSTLHKLQANGIRLAIATGRSPMTVPLEEFPGVQFDVFITFNGSYCYDKDRCCLPAPSPQRTSAPCAGMPPHWAGPCALPPRAALPQMARMQTLPITAPCKDPRAHCRGF